MQVTCCFSDSDLVENSKVGAARVIMSPPPALFYLMAETQFVSETLCALWSTEL